ncbi:hypothetical protein QBC32DRAFT_250012 [Pseudoneurospora amorphoporcata]|uniref:Uncharacterized protein n=1 Tax=Pseudoneurospora amorphoporcata TaxID=241081 RepID=A0AAN6P740_9PEZI|nr:hypothetical protein QBC32DRAFT_250012 [Pseudoneurospora amorphoporcata]
MVTTKGVQSGGRAQETAQTAEPIPNYKRNRSIQFTGPTLRPTKRLRNSREYIPASKRRRTFQIQEQSVKTKEIQQDDDIDEDEDILLHKKSLDVMNSFTQSRDPPLPPTETQPEPPSSATPVKRGRGRPRKHSLPGIAQYQPAFGKQLSERALEQIEALAQETLGPVEATQERDKALDSVEDEYCTAYEAVEPAEDQESQLLEDVDDNVDDESQQEEKVEEKEDADQEENAQDESDTDSDEELPSLSNWKKRTKKQVPPSAQPELGPEHTRPSPVLGSDPAAEFANGDDYPNEEQTDKDDEANNQPPRAPLNRRASPPEDLLLFRAPGSVDDSYQVDMPSNTIISLQSNMQHPGWTDLGKDWAETIVQPYRDQTPKPTTTRVVKYFCEELYNLKQLLDLAHEEASLAKQNVHLRGVREWMIKHMKAIQDIVYMCEQHLAPNGVIKPRHRQSLRQDLFLYGIPMLVLVLSSAYRLGTMKDGYIFGFPRSGRFTRSRVEYLDYITDWIKRLGKKLVPEVSDDEGEDAKDEHLGYVGRFKTKVLERKIIENRQHFMKLLGSWEETLRETLSDIDDAAIQQAERHIARKIARDQAIKKERQAAEEAERAKKKAQYEAFALSTQRPGSQLQSKLQQGQNVTRSTAIPRSSEVATPIDRVPARHHQQQPPHNPDKRWYPRWSEEKRWWLFKELMEIGPRVSDIEYEDWADCLGKPIEEVRHEVEIHRAAAVSVALEKGRSVPWWARVVVE